MSQDQTARPAQAHLEWCYDAVQDVSRTFALTISELKEPMSRDVCVGYLLCRVADTVEDAGHVPPTEQQELLTQYKTVLDPETEETAAAFLERVTEWIPEDPNADWRLVANTPRVVETFRSLDRSSREIIQPAVAELIDGMAMFVGRYAEAGGLRLKTVAELEEYCWYAAGTVGTLVTGLLSRDADPQVREILTENARSFALLLQLVNVTKDVVDDYEVENNVYLPEELLEAEQLQPDDIGDPTSGERFVPVLRELIGRAESYVEGAQNWLEAMPEVRGNTLSAWAIPFLLAIGTLRELTERPADVIETGDVKVSRREVFAVVESFSGETDPSVEELRSRIRSQPFHQY